MSDRGMAIFALLGLFAVAALCSLVHAQQIQQRLESRAVADLEAAEVPWIWVSFDGRDGLLAGAVANDELRRRAEEVVRAIPGVRSVENRLVSRQAEVDARVRLQQEIDDALADSRVEFEAGSAVIAGDGFDLLARLVPLFERHAVGVLEIGGHTDSVGNDEANHELSLRRARAVREALIEAGAPAGRLVAEGYGESRPIADNGTREGRRANRRITFAVRGQDAP